MSFIFDLDWMRDVAVQTVKSFIVYLDFQGLLYFLFGVVFGKVVQAFFPFVELRFVAAVGSFLYTKFANHFVYYL